VGEAVHARRSCRRATNVEIRYHGHVPRDGVLDRGSNVFESASADILRVVQGTIQWVYWHTQGSQREGPGERAARARRTAAASVRTHAPQAGASWIRRAIWAEVRVQVCYPGLGGGQAGLWPSLSRTSARPSNKPDLTRTWPVLSPSRPPARELAPGPQQTPEAPGPAREKPPAPRRAGIPLT
jgi:hypothetical protein